MQRQFFKKWSNKGKELYIFYQDSQKPLKYFLFNICINDLFFANVYGNANENAMFTAQNYVDSTKFYACELNFPNLILQLDMIPFYLLNGLNVTT